jgi:acyl carrier protein
LSTEVTIDEVAEFIRAELIDLGVDEEAITSDAKFDVLDVDSLDVADLMTTVKRKYGVDIPRRELVDVTIGQLVERIVAGVAA